MKLIATMLGGRLPSKKHQKNRRIRTLVQEPIHFVPGYVFFSRRRAIVRVLIFSVYVLWPFFEPTCAMHNMQLAWSNPFFSIKNHCFATVHVTRHRDSPDRPGLRRVRPVRRLGEGVGWGEVGPQSPQSPRRVPETGQSCAPSNQRTGAF